jgi:hypothetical protein
MNKRKEQTKNNYQRGFVKNQSQLHQIHLVVGSNQALSEKERKS